MSNRSISANRSEGTFEVTSNGATPILVSCCGPKQCHPCRAQHMYTSTTFLLAKRYAILSAKPWYILSTKHGLLHPDSHIEPYDLRLGRPGDDGRLEWASMILRQLDQDRSFDCRKIELLAGYDYCRTLVPALQKRGFEVQQPLVGLGHGQRQRWLRLHSSRMTPGFGYPSQEAAR